MVKFCVLLHNNIVQSRLREVITIRFGIFQTHAINMADKSANGPDAVQKRSFWQYNIILFRGLVFMNFGSYKEKDLIFFMVLSDFTFLPRSY